MPGGAQRSIRINPALSAVTNLTVVIGPLVGGAITSVFSTKAVFLFGAACALLGLVSAAGFRPLRAPLEGEEAECSYSSLSAGFAAVAASSPLRLLPAVRLGVQETLVLASALVAASSLAGMVVLRKRVDRAVEEERLLGTNQGSRR